MTSTKREENASKGGITLIDLRKSIGTLGAVLVLFVSLMTGILQYRQSVQADMDKNFRSVIEKLSSKNSEKRLASASSIGTFIDKKKYHDEAIDILTNRLAIELDYNVLNAIRGSLERIKKEEDYKRVIRKLLDIEKSIFIREYALEVWRNNAQIAFEDSKKRYEEREKLFKKSKSEVDKAMLNLLEEEMNRNWKVYYNRKKEFNELSKHRQVVADFISIFLGVTRKFPIEKLEFFFTALDQVVMIEVNLSKSILKRSAFTSSSIIETKFDGSTIIDTVFTNSDMTKSSFVNCKIDSSLFDRAVLKSVDFSGSKFKDVFLEIQT